MPFLLSVIVARIVRCQIFYVFKIIIARRNVVEFQQNAGASSFGLIFGVVNHFHFNQEFYHGCTINAMLYYGFMLHVYVPLKILWWGMKY